MTVKNNLYFNLSALQPQESSTGGSITCVTSNEMIGLVNLSFAVLKLQKYGSLEPTWHPNANKIGYCLQGKNTVSIRSPEGVDVFNIERGDVFFIPQGYIHHIENFGEEESIIAFALNNTAPESLSLASAINSLSDEVFVATFDTKSGFVDGLKRSANHSHIKTLTSAENPGFISSRFKFNIAKSTKTIATHGGYLQLATKTNLPVLDGLGILGFGLNPKGFVEPHWHTNAGELVYVIKGTTKITVLAPDGSINTLGVKAGQGAFAPASHFHNIENVGKDNVEIVAFFSNAQPDYIGIGEVIGSYSNELLGSIFDLPSNYFADFKKPTEPLVIVPI
jgi:oxalate decarboxylase